MDRVMCSDVEVGPLAGTAKQESVYVLFESPGGWSRDVLDGGTFGDELTAQLKSTLAGAGASLQLIRRAGRRGRDVKKLRRCYLVWARHEVIELVLLPGPEDILGLDLSGPGKNGGERIDTPLVLVCTHSKRDQCCAVKGRPLAAQLTQTCPDSVVWESSHMKGHRFAPTVQVMPWAYSYGRLNTQAAQDMAEAALRGELFYPANRGRGIWSERGQVAELAVARELIEDGETPAFGDLVVPAELDGTRGKKDKKAPSQLVRIAHRRDGRQWEVEVEPQTVEGIVASCGKSPKTETAWVAVAVRPVEAED